MEDSVNIITSVWKNGQSVRPNTLYKVRSSLTFGELFEKSIGNDDSILNVEIKCIISDLKGQDTIAVNMGNDVSVCSEFGLKFAKYVVSTPESPPKSTMGNKNNAFNIMMKKATEMKLPDKFTSGDHVKLIAPQRLYNDIIDFLEEENVKWSHTGMESGQRTVRVFRDVLWYLTSHHQKFAEAACKLPSKLHRFSNYNDWKNTRHLKPIIESKKLDELCISVSSIMELPSNNSTANTELVNLLQQVNECMIKMSCRLKKDNKKHQDKFHRASHQFVNLRETALLILDRRL